MPTLRGAPSRVARRAERTGLFGNPNEEQSKKRNIMMSQPQPGKQLDPGSPRRAWTIEERHPTRVGGIRTGYELVAQLVAGRGMTNRRSLQGSTPSIASSRIEPT